MATISDVFIEQIKYFLNKNILPTNSWLDIINDAHDQSFVVAKAIDLIFLNEVYNLVVESMTSGLSMQDFQMALENKIIKHKWKGWHGETTSAGREWRSRLIYETNLRTSYAAGRYKQIQKVKKERPYLIYRHSLGVMQPRPLHVAWDNIILPVDDPWWNTRFPPNGYGCKCRVFSLSDEDLEEDNLQVTSHELIAPGDADIGFQYTPGKNRK